jgi:hypothetical protein
LSNPHFQLNICPDGPVLTNFEPDEVGLKATPIVIDGSPMVKKVVIVSQAITGINSTSDVASTPSIFRLS